jgi:hypothetical protein
LARRRVGSYTAVSMSKEPKSPPPAKPPEKSSGRVKFDDRGNAVWEWSVSTGAFGRDISTDRLKELESPGLSLEDNPLPGVAPDAKSTPAPGGGYDPYSSATPKQPPPPVKKNPDKK